MDKEESTWPIMSSIAGRATACARRAPGGGGGGWLGGDASSFDEGTLVVPYMCSIVHDISTH